MIHAGCVDINSGAAASLLTPEQGWQAARGARFVARWGAQLVVIILPDPKLRSMSRPSHEDDVSFSLRSAAAAASAAASAAVLSTPKQQLLLTFLKVGGGALHEVQKGVCVCD